MNTKRMWIVLTVLVLAALACQTASLAPVTSAAPTSAAPAPVVNTQPNAPAAPANGNPDAQQDTLTALYTRVNAGIVAIINSSGGGSLGSGFVYDANGHIVTNYHVVEGATKVEVDFPSGYKTYGSVIGTDLDSDLAVVSVNAPASELHPVPMGDSSALQVGQTVVAIGNPFGLSGTMTVGVISALGRTLDSAHQTADGTYFTAGDIVQTDAAINPGNSGGPLFNLNGEVIGVNRAIQTLNSTTSGEPINSGIGFAVPSNIVKRVAPVLISSGKYDYPYLGISALPDDAMTLDTINALGLKSSIGAYVVSVVPGGPADQAGIKAGTQSTSVQNLNAGGDLIVAIDGRSIRSFDELLAYLVENKSPGDNVVLTVLRGDQKTDVTVTLGKRPS